MNRYRALVAFALLLASGPAMAQAYQDVATGSIVIGPKAAHIPDSSSHPVRTSRVTLADFASCVIDQHPKSVKYAISLPAGYDEKALNAAATEDCLGNGQLTMDAGLFRGALFAELYRRHESMKSGTVWSYPIPPLAMMMPLSATSPRHAQENHFLLLLSECVYKQQPDAARSVVLTRTTSSEQDTAFQSITPLLRDCIPPGQTVKLFKTSLEGAFGEYLYRALATVPATPASKVQ